MRSNVCAKCRDDYSYFELYYTSGAFQYISFSSGGEKSAAWSAMSRPTFEVIEVTLQVMLILQVNSSFS